MKTIILLLIVWCSAPISISAQNKAFKTYRDECSESFGITIKKPKKFKVIDEKVTYKVNEKRNIGFLYRLILEADSKDCLILFPYFNTAKHHDSIAKNMVYGELKAAFNLGSDKDMKMKLNDGKFMIQGASDSVSYDKPDFNEYIEIIAGEKAQSYFNADTVYIYQLPLSEPYRNYNECIGVNAIKKGRPSAIIKIFFTKECNRKEEYMKQLFNSIHYSDIIPSRNIRLFSKSLEEGNNMESYCENFPMTFRYFANIIYSHLKNGRPTVVG